MHHERKQRKFSWQDLGKVDVGRPNLGPMVPVLVYRLMQYTLWDVLSTELGAEQANRIVVRAGKRAGEEFCRNMLDTSLPIHAFISQLQQVLKEQAIGILRIEQADLEALHFTLTVAEDLDCSGLPCTDEVVCQYDEGFISGIFEVYTGKPFHVKEVDCWASGERVCRFSARVQEDEQHDR
ncbi:4-vinyl reductase [Desulfobulbus rhabdoformis]|uniref:V4R domain-containing protein n=1 Tax=Desulfobulbus rhabdoformis TaxID=34032 RepID=UPI001963E874|nr:V4R domain-containing protein [Desulfobulbus rhabdoformis]MBM9616892.1 4-vinyl reductase [Desulfobulbus rhabdoformis]